MPDPEITSRDTIRLPEHAIRSLLEALDRDSTRKARLAGQPDPTAQGLLRFPSCKPVVLEVNRPGEGAVRFLAIPRFLTPDSITVVHGVFLHPHTRCVVHLRTIDGERTAFPGRLTSCAYAAARMHESVVAFDAPIDTSFYIPVTRPAMLAEAALASAATAAPNPASTHVDDTSPASTRSPLDLAKSLVDALQSEESRTTIACLLDELRLALVTPLPSNQTTAEAPANAPPRVQPPASAA